MYLSMILQAETYFIFFFIFGYCLLLIQVSENRVLSGKQYYPGIINAFKQQNVY